MDGHASLRELTTIPSTLRALVYSQSGRVSNGTKTTRSHSRTLAHLTALAQEPLLETLNLGRKENMMAVSLAMTSDKI